MSHIPVLLDEVIKYLNIQPNFNYIDATFGEGGYTKEILRASSPNGKVLAIDWNEEAISYFKKEFGNVNSSKYPAPNGGGSEAGSTSLPEEPQPLRSGPRPTPVTLDRLTVVNGNFSHIKDLAKGNNFDKVNGIVFDLGLSENLISSSGRGFSYLKDEPLIMTFSKEQATSGGKTARGVINTANEEELTFIFKEYGEENNSHFIAKAIIRERTKKKITTTGQLVGIIKKGGKGNNVKTLARIFQALRIYVNDELENLTTGLNGAWSVLGTNSNLVVVSFHSLEDRIVKNFFRGKYKEEKGELIIKKPVTPSKEEIENNKKSRSAKLRAIRKK